MAYKNVFQGELWNFVFPALLVRLGRFKVFDNLVSKTVSVFFGVFALRQKKKLNSNVRRKTMTEKVKTLLVASGGGSDANSIMAKHDNSCLGYADVVALVSTRKGEKCLEKAGGYNIPSFTIARKDYDSIDDFNNAFEKLVVELGIELIFLVGCIHRIYPISGVVIKNIHPADPVKHGGDGMYGLEVHRRVILEIVDKIQRGKASEDDVFYTCPTVHEAVYDYDSGNILLQSRVVIPSRIIKSSMFYVFNETLNFQAVELQRHVLPYEWLMLPMAVEMAAKSIIDERERDIE